MYILLTNKLMRIIYLIALLATRAYASMTEESTCVPDHAMSSSACSVRKSICFDQFNRDFVFVKSSLCALPTDAGCLCADSCAFSCEAGCNEFADRCAWNGSACVKKNGSPELDANGLCPERKEEEETSYAPSSSPTLTPSFSDSPTASPSLSPVMD
jgi:hypothetical protein